MASGSHQFFVCQLINRWISDWNISLQSPKPTTLKKQWWTRAAAFCRIMPRERERDYYYFSSKQQNAKLFTLSCEMKDRLLLQQHHFILCYAGWCSTAPHSHLMVHRVVMKLWFVIFLQLHCCKTCRILTAQRSVALGHEFVALSLWIGKGTKSWLDWL